MSKERIKRIIGFQTALGRVDKAEKKVREALR